MLCYVTSVTHRQLCYKANNVSNGRSLASPPSKEDLVIGGKKKLPFVLLAGIGILLEYSID